MHKFNRIRQVAPTCRHGRTHCRHLANAIEPSACTAAMRLMYNYFDHLLFLNTPSYTEAKTAERFELNTVLWAVHTIQPSSFNCKTLLYEQFSSFDVSRPNYVNNYYCAAAFHL